MEINVSVDHVDLNTPISSRRVRLSDDEGDEYSERPVTIADLVAEQALEKLAKEDYWPSLRDRVVQIRAEQIREAVRPAIDVALTKPMRKTTHYGEVTGPETTLTELIVEEARTALNKPADRNSYNDRTGTTLIQKIVREEVAAALTAELKAAIAEEKAKVVKAVRAKAGELIAEAVKQGIGG